MGASISTTINQPHTTEPVATEPRTVGPSSIPAGATTTIKPAKLPPPRSERQVRAIERPTLAESAREWGAGYVNELRSMYKAAIEHPWSGTAIAGATIAVLAAPIWVPYYLPGSALAATAAAAAPYIATVAKLGVAAAVGSPLGKMLYNSSRAVNSNNRSEALNAIREAGSDAADLTVAATALVGAKQAIGGNPPSKSLKSPLPVNLSSAAKDQGFVREIMEPLAKLGPNPTPAQIRAIEIAQAITDLKAARDAQHATWDMRQSFLIKFVETAQKFHASLSLESKVGEKLAKRFGLLIDEIVAGELPGGYNQTFRFHSGEDIVPDRKFRSLGAVLTDLEKVVTKLEGFALTETGPNPHLQLKEQIQYVRTLDLRAKEAMSARITAEQTTTKLRTDPNP